MQKISVFLFFILITHLGFAQRPETTNSQRSLTLSQVIHMAQTQSPAYKQATTTLNTSYWMYRTYRSNYLPQLTLRGTVPNLNRSIDPITQNDGTEVFRRRSFMTGDLGISLSQNIGLTGGQFFISSQVNRIDLFEPIARTTYSANPATIGFIQPILRYNQLLWDKKIEPLRYEESMRQFNEDMELISVGATELFFDLLLAQISQEIAQKNQANTDTLYKIAQGRYELGKIAENELLQLELSLLNAGLAVNRASLEVDNSMLRLKNYLGITDDTRIELAEPSIIPDYAVDQATAIAEARKNRRAPVEFRRRLLEAERGVARARGETGFQADVFASFGLTQSAATVPDLYVNPLDQQQVRVGFTVPIMNWGRTKAQVQTAISEQELEQTRIAQDEVNFSQQVVLQVNQFNLIQNQLVIAIRSDEIAQKRYDITKNRYVIGKIGITDLNIAQQEKDEAKRAYISALRTYWNAYYNLRLLTLYDFEKGQTINYYADLN